MEVQIGLYSVLVRLLVLARFIAMNTWRQEFILARFIAVNTWCQEFRCSFQKYFHTSQIHNLAIFILLVVYIII